MNKEHIKTNIGLLQGTHNNLGDKFSWYHNWHKHPHHCLVHMVIFLAGATLAVTALFFSAPPPQMAYAPVELNNTVNNQSNNYYPEISKTSHTASALYADLKNRHLVDWTIFTVAMIGLATMLIYQCKKSKRPEESSETSNH